MLSVHTAHGGKHYNAQNPHLNTAAYFMFALVVISPVFLSALQNVRKPSVQYVGRYTQSSSLLLGSLWMRPKGQHCKDSNDITPRLSMCGCHNIRI